MLRLAWKNLWRNRSRSFITIAAIVFAVILSVLASSLKDGIFDNLVKNVVSFYTGYVQVHKKGYQDEQILDNSFSHSKPTQDLVLSQPNISSLTRRLESFALASSEEFTRGCLVVGILPEEEDRVTSLKNKLTGGSYLKAGDRSVLLSAGMAERLKLKVGDTIILIGQGYHGSTAAGKYPVKGIIKFGSPQLNDKVLFMDLAAAQDLFSAPDMITSYILSVKDENQLQRTTPILRRTLGPEYEVLTWEEIMPEIKQHIQSDSNNMKVVQGILYLLICFGIFSTQLMMMVERKFELGMLLAIGMNKGRLMLLLMAESILTVLLGCIIGIMASIPVVYYLNRHPIRIGGETARAYERFGFEAIFPTSTDSSNFVYQGIVVLIIGLVLSIYPLYKVGRLDAASTLKK